VAIEHLAIEFEPLHMLLSLALHAQRRTCSHGARHPWKGRGLLDHVALLGKRRQCRSILVIS
jgi:hypothetical protein